MVDAWTLLQRRRRETAGAPLVTFVDVGGQERTELSAISLENAAAKIANCLRDELGVEPGAVLALHLPVHWQRSAWCAGAWTAGCLIAPEGDPADADLVIASIDRAPTLVEAARGPVGVVSLHPLGLPIVDRLPEGTFDVSVPVRMQPDAYLFESPSGDTPALRIGDEVLTQAEVLSRGAERATAWGLEPGGRLVAGEDLDVADAWLVALAVPLATRSSVLLVAGGPWTDELVASERVTATAAPQR